MDFDQVTTTEKGEVHSNQDKEPILPIESGNILFSTSLTLDH